MPMRYYIFAWEARYKIVKANSKAILFLIKKSNKFSIYDSNSYTQPTAGEGKSGVDCKSKQKVYYNPVW